MIAVIMHVRTKPDKAARFVELITQLQEDVRANEPDTYLFQVMRSADDANSFAFAEIFASEDARNSHARRPYHVAMSEEGYSCLDGDPDIRVFETLGDAARTGVHA